MTWIIEDKAFAGGDILLPALREQNQDVILWDDSFWDTEEYRSFPNGSVFHGSLENAARLCRMKLPNIISLCDEERFSYSYLCEQYNHYLLNGNPVFTTIAGLMEQPALLDVLQGDRVFARPDSPLKAFSGRVLEKRNLTPAHFDYGFYHSDMNLPIVLCEYRNIEAEWRFVCMHGTIVTGCEYAAEGRKGVGVIDCNEKNKAWCFAQTVANEGKQKDSAYIIDVCQSNGALNLVEMNPFSGADLYLCDGERIVHLWEYEQAIRGSANSPFTGV